MSIFNDPVAILLVGAMLGSGFGIAVAKANIARGVAMRQSFRAALISTCVAVLLTYLIISILRWLL